MTKQISYRKAIREVLMHAGHLGKLRELSLFAGAGGGILGGTLLGWEPVGAVELASYPREVLKRRQEDGMLEHFPIFEDIREFNGRAFRGKVDIVTGGFPCKDISIQKARAEGLEGKKSSLWFEMARVIAEVGPTFVLIENTHLLNSRGLSHVVSNMADLGYDCSWGSIATGMFTDLHKRERIWVFCWKRSLSVNTQAMLNKFGCQEIFSYLLGHWWNIHENGYRQKKEPPKLLPRWGMAIAGEVYSCQKPDETDTIRRYKWATPVAGDGSNTAGASQLKRRSPPLNAQVGGALNPEWVEWLMGWPIGWTGLSPMDGLGDWFTPLWWEKEPEIPRVFPGASNRPARVRALGNAQTPIAVASAIYFLSPWSPFMRKRAKNPIIPSLANKMHKGEVDRINSLEGELLQLEEKVMLAYERYDIEEAERLESIHAELQERMEDIASEVLEDFGIDEREPENYENVDIEAVEHIFASIYARYLSGCHYLSGDRDLLLEQLRGTANWAPSFKFKGATDEELLDAAKDAYESRKSRIERFRGKRTSNPALSPIERAFVDLRRHTEDCLPDFPIILLKIDCEFSKEDHDKEWRVFAHTLHEPFTVCVHSELNTLSDPFVYGIMAHEFGHIISDHLRKDPGEEAADLAVKDFFEIDVCYGSKHNIEYLEEDQLNKLKK